MSRLEHIQYRHRGKPTTMLEVLRNVTGLSDGELMTVIKMGGGYKGKFREKDASARIESGDQVSVYFRLPIVEPEDPFDRDWLLEQNKSFLIACKPSGIPTQGRRDCDYDSFYESLQRHLGGYLGLHHRLDQDTSGLLLFTRDRACNKVASALFAERKIKKVYLALARVALLPKEESFYVDAAIHTKKGPKGVQRFVDPAGQSASTAFRILAQAEGLALLEARPLTGRTHQIRVHAAHVGLPLLGDTFYGGPSAEHRFFLHCARLTWSAEGGFPAGDFHAPIPLDFGERLPSALKAAAEAWEALC